LPGAVILTDETVKTAPATSATMGIAHGLQLVAINDYFCNLLFFRKLKNE
jgi:hypothetical protein